MNKKFCVLAIFLCLCLLGPQALATLEAGTGSGFYANDLANVLSRQTEETLVEYNAVLESECSGAQLVVVTTAYLDEDSDIAATRLMNDWGVGSAGENNGMLLLLVTEEYRGWLAVGDGLRYVFDDETAEEYLDRYFWDDVDQDRFDEAVQNLTEQLYHWYMDYYDVTLDSSEGYEPQLLTIPRSVYILGVVLMVLLALVVIWLASSVGRYTRMRRGGYTGGFFPVLFFLGGRPRRRPPPPPPPSGGYRGPSPGPGPGSRRNAPPPPPRSSSYRSAPPPPRSPSRSRPRGSGFGGFSSGSGAGRSGSGFRPSRSSGSSVSSRGAGRSSSSSPRSSGGSRGIGGGGHSSGRGAGRR